MAKMKADNWEERKRRCGSDVFFPLPCVLFMIVCVGPFYGCSDSKTASKKKTLDTDWMQIADVEKGNVVASVDSYPITVDDVTNVMRSSRSPLSPQEALDVLLEEALLFQEALKRGYGSHPEIGSEHRNAMVMTFLKKTAEAYTEDDLDKKALRQHYENLKAKRFVHGIQRKVIHAVARTDLKQTTDTVAQNIATEMATAISAVTTEEEFRRALAPIVKNHKNIVKIEVLPRFGEDNKRFAKSFVDATYQVPSAGMVSSAFKTSFGWHVLLVLEEYPPENITFEQAMPILQKEVIDAARANYMKGVIEEIENDGDVFLYDVEWSTIGDISGTAGN